MSIYDIQLGYIHTPSPVKEERPMTPEQRHREQLRDGALREGKLVEISSTCAQTGRRVREFVGAKSTWMDQFKGEARLMIRIDKHAKNPYQMISGGSKV